MLLDPVPTVTHFGTATNLLLSLSVTIYGLFSWLFKSKSLEGDYPYRHRAYRCWWASWFCWVLAWGVLTIAMATGNYPVPTGLKVLTLIFDNLNSVFLVLVYFVILVGNEFDTKRILRAFGQISGSIGIVCIILYLLAPVLGMNFSYEIHRTWSLCIGVFSPILVGWAFNLRYNTRLVLIVGLAYGLMQPLIYSTELETVQTEMVRTTLLTFKPVIAMTLGALKVTWAIVFMQVLTHGAPTEGSMVSGRTQLRFHFFSRWDKKVLGHALVLGVSYCSLLVSLFMYFEKGLTILATALGILSAFMAITDWFWKLWDKGNMKLSVSKSKSKVSKERDNQP